MPVHGSIKDSGALSFFWIVLLPFVSGLKPNGRYQRYGLEGLLSARHDLQYNKIPGSAGEIASILGNLLKKGPIKTFPAMIKDQ